MDQEIWKPHDRLFKQLLGEPGNAASFLESNLPHELTSRMELGALQVLQESFIDEQFRQSEADLLFSVPIADRLGYVYILFEHQSAPDAFMALRLLAYMVRIWERCRREEPAGNAVVRILGDALGAYGRNDFKVRVTRAIDALNELAHAPGFARYLEILFRYILEVYDIPKQELFRIATQTIRSDVEETVMTTYEQLIEEGKQIGLREGGQIGANKVLSRLIAKRFHASADSLAPLLANLTPEQQDELSDKVLDAAALDEIVEWLRAIRRN